MKLFDVLRLLLAGLLLCSAARQHYRGFHVIKVQSAAAEDLDFLLQNEDMIDVWRMTKNRQGLVTATFHVNSNFLAETYEHLIDRQLEYWLITNDLQREIDAVEEKNEEAKKRHLPDQLADFTQYYDYNQLQVFLNEQATLCGSYCSIINVGTSFEGRALNLIKLTGEPDPLCQQKPIIWIDAGIHAREWIAVSTAQYIINRLIEEYSTDSFVKEIRDRYDWYILPSMNPDGYDFTWTTNRLWRKTRQVYNNTACIGADPNRNFDFQWMTVGASSNPCSETFAGPRPYSEPETEAVREYLMSMYGNVHLFLTLHSYGQLWMAPYGYTTDPPNNYASMATVGEAGIAAIFAIHGEIYEFGSASSILYLSSGTSRDWAAGAMHIPYVYTLELRDESSFVLPPESILPTGQEIWAGLKTAVDVMNQEYPGNCVIPATNP